MDSTFVKCAVLSVVFAIGMVNAQIAASSASSSSSSSSSSGGSSTANQVPFDVNFVELDHNKMMTTGDNNYAICSHSYPSNWRSASVNGDEVTISTRDKIVLLKKLSTLTNEERTNLENTKNTMTAVIRVGPYNVKTQTGFAKLTTFDKNGGTSTMGTGNGASDGSSSSSSTSDGTNILKTGKDAFILSKPDLPFNWHRVFVIEDVATVVHKDGRVIMLPIDLMRPDEKAKILQLKQEVEKASKSTEKLKSQITSSLKSPMEFVNKALGGFFG